MLPNNDKMSKEKFLIVGIFLANIVSITLRETNSLSIEENSLLPNHITPFEDIYIRNIRF